MNTNQLPIDVFHKGWTDAALFADFAAAVKKGDCYDIAMAVRAQGADRKPVDAYVKAMRLPRQPSGQLPRVPEVMTDERRAELVQLSEFANNRDEKISSMDASLPLGMRELSFFLADTLVPRYAAKKDYMTTERSYKSVMAGDAKKEIKSGNRKNIVTLRDAASYVHSDDPFVLWGNVAMSLMMYKVPQRTQSRINDHDGEGQSRFTVFGGPFLKGIIGHAILMSGPVSFANKWDAMVPRPEQLHFEWLNEFLPMAYPEGSPMHPSRPAMHSFAALVCCYVLLALFDGHHELPNGRTVEEELILLADNVGYFRVFAGVHYQSDHDDSIETAKKVAEQIVRPFIR